MNFNGELTITLYPFHLSDYYSKFLTQEQLKPDYIWKQFEEMGKEFGIKELQWVSSSHHNDKKNFNFTSGYKNLKTPTLINPDSGSIETFIVDDVYTADFTITFENVKNLDNIENLNLDLNGWLFPNKFNSSLGQTLILYIKPEEGCQGNSNLITENCIKSILKNYNGYKSELIGQGKISSLYFSEYSNQQLNPSDRCHVLVYFESGLTSEELLDNINTYIFKLLLYRSKVIYPAYKAKEWHTRALQLSQEIEPYILQESSESIAKKVLEYRTCLRYLRTYLRNVITYTKEYNLALSSLKKLIDQSKDNICFLEDFEKIDCDKINSQIQIYIDEVVFNDELFQSLMEQERERKLQHNIATYGIGLAVAGLTAQCLPYAIPTSQSKNLPKIPFFSKNISIFPHPIVIAFLTSLFFGLVAALIAKRSFILLPKISHWLKKTF